VSAPDCQTLGALRLDAKNLGSRPERQNMGGASDCLAMGALRLDAKNLGSRPERQNLGSA